MAYPSHLSGLVLEGLNSDPIHVAIEIRLQMKRISSWLFSCTLRQQLPSGMTLAPPEFERDLAGSWLYAEDQLGSRLDAHAHVLMALVGWRGVIDHWRNLPIP